MPKTKISEFSSTPANNTDIDSIFIGEGMAPSNVNDAIRELMAQLKDFQTGAAGDSFNGPVGTTTAAAGAFTTLSATGNVTLGDASTDTLNVGNGGLIKDASGNLGLGVTPSAWAGYKPLQAGSGASFGGYAGDALSFMGSNTYNDNTNWRYILSGNAAARYQQSAGVHAWYNAPSGTAGNAITFTQAMTLDASGNLALGTTSASRRLHVYATSSVPVRIETNTSDTKIEILTTSGTQFIQGSANNLLFGTNNTEQARIDSSGNLLVGTTTAPNATFLCKVNSIGLQASNPADSTKWRQMAFANNSADAVLYFPNGSNTPTLSAAGAWTNASDGRQKTNITDIKYGLNTVLSAQPHSYNRTDVEGDFIGFVAQELQTVIPEVVFGSDETSYSVDYGSLVAVTFKAIQEQQAIIESLKARLDAANL